MAEATYMYKCSKCGKTSELPEGRPAPECCEKIMVKIPLDQCTIPDHPEMIRNTDEGEPCDDGRGKQTSD